MRTGREFRIAQKAALTVYLTLQKFQVEWYNWDLARKGRHLSEKRMY